MHQTKILREIQEKRKSNKWKKLFEEKKQTGEQTSRKLLKNDSSVQKEKNEKNLLRASPLPLLEKYLQLQVS